MCLTALHIDPNGLFPFVCLANRDEFHHRATAPLHRWQEEGIFAGKDLQSGGTWMGLSSTGHFALLTNVRNAALNKGNDAPSRGHLVTQYLINNTLPESTHLSRFSGFNLIAGELKPGAVNLSYLTNQAEHAPKTLSTGVHVLSNGTMNEMWPKSKVLADGLKKMMALPTPTVDQITDAGLLLLSDKTVADDADLPATGVPYEWEKMLSAAKIVSPAYGTRCSTVLVMTAEGVCHLTETSFDPSGEPLGPAVQFKIKLRNPCTDAH